MDPDACLKEMLELANRSYEDDDAERLATLVQAMDEWMTKGGFLPEKWSKFGR